MSQFLIPPPSKRDMKGDLVSNWELFRQLAALCYRYETKLATMGKECLQACTNLPMTAEQRQDTDVILTKLSE